jgi:hypothetical protein
VARDGDASLLDLRTDQETPLPSRAQGGVWASLRELWVTDGGDLKALDLVTGKSRVLLSVVPQRFSASISIDRQTGDAFTTVVQNEADIWLMDLSGEGADVAPAAEGR